MIRTISENAPPVYFQNEAEARKAATKVVKESDAVVKFGETNGRICLHIKLNRASETIYCLADWDSHRWNKTNKPKEKRVEPGLMEAIKNEQT